MFSLFRGSLGKPQVRLDRKWIENFLFGRYQRVVIKGISSSPLAVTSGVPQGSVLGPSLFLVYVNDMGDSLQHSSISLFADDALIYRPINNNSDTSFFQQDLLALEKWADDWNMVFNVNKCQVVLFDRGGKISSNSVSYTLYGVPLEVVESFRYLGVHVSNDFSWDMHINSITSAAYRRLGMIKRVLYGAPRNVKKIAYMALCRPVMEFASEVWDPYLVRQQTQLENIQRRAVRFIAGLRGVESVTEAREKLGLELLGERRKSARMVLLIKIIANNGHQSLVAAFDDIISSSHSHDTSSATINNPRALTTNNAFYHNSFLPRTYRNIRGNL